MTKKNRFFCFTEADRKSPTSPSASAATVSSMSNSTSCHSSSSSTAAVVAAPVCRTSSSLGQSHQVSPPPMDAADTRSPPTDGSTDNNSSTGATNQLNKLKRFLSTVQQFADDVSTDIGDRVRVLILALVVSSICLLSVHLMITDNHIRTFE